MKIYESIFESYLVLGVGVYFDNETNEYIIKRLDNRYKDGYRVIRTSDYAVGLKILEQARRYSKNAKRYRNASIVLQY